MASERAKRQMATFKRLGQAEQAITTNPTLSAGLLVLVGLGSFLLLKGKR